MAAEHVLPGTSHEVSAVESLRGMRMGSNHTRRAYPKFSPQKFSVGHRSNRISHRSRFNISINQNCPNTVYYSWRTKQSSIAHVYLLSSSLSLPSSEDLSHQTPQPPPLAPLPRSDPPVEIVHQHQQIKICNSLAHCLLFLPMVIELMLKIPRTDQMRYLRTQDAHTLFSIGCIIS